MISREQVAQLAQEFMVDTETYLVDVTIHPGNAIVVEIDNNEGVTIAQCAALSRFIEEKLDREVEDYELEVGSAGLTSPFKVLQQYKKNIGNDVELLTKDGRKLYGRLESADETAFSVVIVKKIKPEGAKKKVEVEETLTWRYEEVKLVKYLLKV